MSDNSKHFSLYFIAYIIGGKASSIFKYYKLDKFD